MGEVDPKPARDLFGAPGRSPPSILAATVAPPDPTRLWARYRRAVAGSNHTTETVLYISPQLIVRSKCRDLRAPRALVGVPLGGRGSIIQVPASGRGVPPQFARDRRRGSFEPASDLAHSAAAGMKESDLFSLDER
jgi:hypothetical protein